MKTVLRMQFETFGGVKSTVSLPDPKADLDSETIKTAMLSVIEEDIFTTKNGSLHAPVNAKIVETSEVVFDLA